MDIIDQETHDLLFVVTFIPDKFKDVLIFESDEIENFDIGFESFFLAIRNDIDVHQGWNFFDINKVIENMYKKYFVYTHQPNIDPDKYYIKFINKKIISLPVNMLGEVDNDPKASYNSKIKRGCI